MNDMISAVLERFSRVEQVSAVAAVLLGALERLGPRDAYETAFADQAELSLVLGGSAVTRGSVHALLGAAADTPPGLPPDESEAVVASVRALFLLLLRYDGRVRQLVMVGGHCVHTMLRTTPPRRERVMRLLDSATRSGPSASGGGHSMIARTDEYLRDLEHARLDAAYIDARTRAYVDDCTRRWLYGLNLPWPAGTHTT